MFIDWLTAHQDYDFDLPVIGDRGSITVDFMTGQQSQLRCFPYQHEGSYSTQLNIRVNGRRLRVEGNPSRFARLDNLFGLTSLDDCFRVFNRELLALGLPPLTKCTRIWRLQGEDGSKAQTVSDGAVVERLDITTNKSVGQGCVADYLRAVSGLNFGHMKPLLHSNGCTVGWHGQTGSNRLQYPSIYDKANDMSRHLLPKVRREFGEESPEFSYVQKLHQFCEEAGVVRFEQKLHSEFLRRHRLAFWGMSDMSKLRVVHDEFLNIDQKLVVTAMSFENIAERLVSCGVVDTTKAANTTAMYAIQWMHGQHFDFSKKQVQTHRARLRKIGIDIAAPCDITKFSPVYIKKAKEVEVSTLAVPSWYRAAEIPTLRAA